MHPKIMNFSTSNCLIALIWISVLAGSIMGPSDVQSLGATANFSPTVTIAILLMPVLLFGGMSLWEKDSPFYHPTLARHIDGRFGEGALASFLVRLRPLLLFAAASAIQGGLGLILAVQTNQPSGVYVLSGFFVSGAIGFAISHWLHYRRKAIGVHPAATAATTPPEPERLSLRQALRRYWPNLSGVALFPTVFFIDGGRFIPSELMVVISFVAFIPAALPYTSGKAPYTFGFVVMATFAGGAVFAILLIETFRVLLA